MHKHNPLLPIVLLSLTALSLPAASQDHRFDVEARVLVLLGNGEPANDMPGFGLAGHWQVRENWYVGAAVDQVSFDFERPYEIIGLTSTEEIDAGNEFTRVSAWVERRYPLSGPWHWFWTAGAGWASLDAGDARGFTTSGSAYDIVTEADDELHLMLSAGARWRPTRNLAVGLAAHLERHEVSYVVTDRVSGATGKVGSQTPLGFSVGVQWSF